MAVEKYGAVLWLDGNPKLDGMFAFDDKPRCLEFINTQEALTPGGGFVTTDVNVVSVSWTMIRIIFPDEME